MCVNWFSDFAVVIEMANGDACAEIRVDEAASNPSNGSNDECSSKTVTQEVEDKVDGMTLDEPQGHFFGLTLSL